MLFDQITFEVIAKAIKIYLEIAYDGEEITNPLTKKKLEPVLKARTKEELLSSFQYELINGVPSYKIQLGSKKYPFLKLVLEKTSFSENYGFYIDRHSEYIATDSSSPNFQKELALKEHTKKLKMTIENTFDSNNLPTYRSFVRNYVKATKESVSKPNNGRLILLVEDDEDINEFHSMELSFMGYNVESVFSGYDAIKNVENKYYDLMVLDLMMSGISGQEVIKLLHDDIDIFVLSALNDEYTRNTCLSLGAKKYLSKPISKKQLQSELENYFNET